MHSTYSHAGITVKEWAGLAVQIDKPAIWVGMEDEVMAPRLEEGGLLAGHHDLAD